MEVTSSSPRNIHHQAIESSNNTITSSSSSPTPPQTPNKPQEIAGNNNPYPTTFVQADTSNFKQVVQLLTGSPSSTAAANNNSNSSIPPIKSTPQKKQGFKLYERRNSLKNGFMMINTSASAEQHHQPHHRCSPRELLSPSILDFPSLVLSPIKPPEKNLSCDKSWSPDLLLDQEEKAIAEKKFYLSPRTEDVETPQLLTLFPLTSPRVSGSSSS